MNRFTALGRNVAPGHSLILLALPHYPLHLFLGGEDLRKVGALESCFLFGLRGNLSHEEKLMSEHPAYLMLELLQQSVLGHRDSQRLAGPR